MGGNIVRFSDPDSDPNGMEAMMLPDLHDLIVGGFKSILVLLAIPAIVFVAWFPIFAIFIFGEEVAFILLIVWLGLLFSYGSRRQK